MATLQLTASTLAVTPAAGQLEFDGHFYATDSANVRGKLNRLIQRTVVATTSGTLIDFTSIPNWVKRITVMLNGVSTNAAGNRRYFIQLGSGTIQTTGYISQASSIGAAGNTTTSSQTTAAFVLQGYAPTASKAFTGNIVITNITGNTWVSSGLLNEDTGTDGVSMSAGAVTLASALDTVRITTAPTADTFDGGSVNILYEG